MTNHTLAKQNQALYTGTQASAIDTLAIGQFGHRGLDLMTRAGESAFAELVQRVTTSTTSPVMLVLCGSGNNGGDGYVVARCALDAGWQVHLVAAGEPRSDEARQVRQRFLQAGGEVHADAESAVDKNYDAVVDALLGIGLSSAPRAPFDQLIELANEQRGIKFALDVPSGVDADTGQAFVPCFQADITLSFIVRKVGLMTGAGAGACGELRMDDLGIGSEVYASIDPVARELEPDCLPVRASDSHKGSFGHVLIAGAGEGMLGAGLLAAKAALRTGSGKVHLLSNVAHLDMPSCYCPEIMSEAFEDALPAVAKRADVLVLGPGLGLDDWARRLFAALIEAGKPMVIDADALTLLAESDTSLAVSGDSIVTPHPGEAARLLGCTTAEIQADRLSAAQTIADKYSTVCVLKGAGTVVVERGTAPFISTVGNAGMATAGVGDVLSGMLGALLGQGMAPLEAARTAVWLHSYAADQWVRSNAQRALIASDIVDLLPVVLESAPVN